MDDEFNGKFRLEMARELGREPDLVLVRTKAKKVSLQFLFSLTIGT